jgi:hypothetical protein
MKSAWSARSYIICKPDSFIRPSSFHTWETSRRKIKRKKEERKNGRKKENTNLSSFYLSCHSLPLTFGGAEIPPADTIALG